MRLRTLFRLTASFAWRPFYLFGNWRRRQIGALRLGAMGANCRIYPLARIYSPKGVHLGDGVVINDFVHIWGGGGVEIGTNSIIAAGSVITSQTHDVGALMDGIPYADTSVRAAVKIGRNVWIGSNVVVLPGVTIGDDSVIGAGAVVTKDIPARSLALGTPARVVKSLSVPSALSS